MNSSNHSQVNIQTLGSVMARAGLSIAEAARQLGIAKQSLHTMITGRESVSPRVRRDLPLVIAARIEGLSDTDVRAAIFNGGPTDRDTDSHPSSVLTRRLAVLSAITGGSDG